MRKADYTPRSKKTRNNLTLQDATAYLQTALLEIVSFTFTPLAQKRQEKHWRLRLLFKHRHFFFYERHVPSTTHPLPSVSHSATPFHIADITRTADSVVLLRW